jgi:hypothetical protein
MWCLRHKYLIAVTLVVVISIRHFKGGSYMSFDIRKFVISSQWSKNKTMLHVKTKYENILCFIVKQRMYTNIFMIKM